MYEYLRGSKAVTAFVTFYVHWLLILALAAVVIHDPPEAVSVFLNAAFSSEFDDATPVDIAPIEIAEFETPDEPMTQDAVQELLTDMSFQETSGMENLLAEYASEQAKMSASTAAEGEPGDPAASAAATVGDGINPAPPHAVSAGSFSVWTEPANPDPGEPYRVIIQVQVPKGVTEYDVTDLEGFVVGSDGYRKPVPGFWRGHLPVVDGFARFVVPIVSADARVHDTVLIRSRMLKEIQKLIIEF